MQTSIELDAIQRQAERIREHFAIIYTASQQPAFKAALATIAASDIEAYRKLYAAYRDGRLTTSLLHRYITRIQRPHQLLSRRERDTMSRVTLPAAGHVHTSWNLEEREPAEILIPCNAHDEWDVAVGEDCFIIGEPEAQDSSDELHTTDTLRENHALTLANYTAAAQGRPYWDRGVEFDDLLDHRHSPSVIDEYDADAISSQRWVRIQRAGHALDAIAAYAWDRADTADDEGTFMAATASADDPDSWDPQLGMTGRVLVKRGTHRKLAGVVPHSDERAADAALLGQPVADELLAGSNPDVLLEQPVRVLRLTVAEARAYRVAGCEPGRKARPVFGA